MQVSGFQPAGRETAWEERTEGETLVRFMRCLNAVLIVANIALTLFALCIGDTDFLIWNMGIACLCTLLFVRASNERGE